MCKLGDIIVVKNYIGEDGEKINQHSFVVINDTPGSIEGLNYDLVTNVMSSFKSDEHRLKKLKFEENLEIISSDIISKMAYNNKSGFIKADQLIYFDKKNLNYFVLGRISDDLLDELMILILSLSKKGKLRNNLNNIKETEKV